VGCVVDRGLDLGVGPVWSAIDRTAVFTNFKKKVGGRVVQGWACGEYESPCVEVLTLCVSEGELMHCVSVVRWMVFGWEGRFGR